MRFSVQVSRHYGGYRGVGGQIGMHTVSNHDTMQQARTSAKSLARKFPKNEVLIYDSQSKKVTTVRAMPKQNPAIPAQLRRLPSGEIQVKIPLNAKNVKAQVQAIRKALGRRVKSAVIVGGKVARKLSNPAYWQKPWVVSVDSGSVGMTEALSRGFNTEEQARDYIRKLKARSMHLGRVIQLLHNTGTNKPGGVKVVSSKSY